MILNYCVFRSSIGVIGFLTAWSVTEVVRYSFYALTLIEKCPFVLTWLRQIIIVKIIKVSEIITVSIADIRYSSCCILWVLVESSYAFLEHCLNCELNKLRRTRCPTVLTLPFTCISFNLSYWSYICLVSLYEILQYKW